MNRLLDTLHPYPFERLAELKRGFQPNGETIDLSLGEPRHPTPRLILDSLRDALPELSRYPVTAGSRALRDAIAAWLLRRYALAEGSIDPERQIIPVNGTREALFAVAQAVVDRSGPDKPIVILPNPFYQIYEGACLMAGAEPYYLNSLPEAGYRPDLDTVPQAVWRRCQLVYVCSPGNPTGIVFDAGFYRKLLALSDRYGFVVAADECYSEIYPDENRPPLGLLQHAAQDARGDFRNIVVFNSLSKRSNVPGMRSGFVAGDAAVLQRFLLYRTYHGCAMAPPVQAASIAAWQDEAHVVENRRLYREKFAAVLAVLGDVVEVDAPQGGFCLWTRLPVDDVEFTVVLMRERNVIVLPGRFLSRDSHGVNPGERHLRVALVAALDNCVEAAKRIRAQLQSSKDD